MYAKKIVFFFFFILSSIAYGSSQPKWLIEDPDHKGVYFRGESPWYITKDALVAQAATQDALKDAYAKVSDYFGLNIKSSTTIKEGASNYGATSSLSQTIQTKTNQLIFDLKPIKTYKEYSNNGEHFKVHVLVLLDPQTEVKIKAQMKKDQEEFYQLQEKILQALNERDFYKAENLLAIAKGKRAAYIDDTLTQLEMRLKKLKEGALHPTLELDKKVYRPDEVINITVSLNKKGYLYMLYDLGDSYEMFFPSRYQRNNHLEPHESIFFPNDTIETIAYKEYEGKKLQIIALASKKRLPFRRYIDDVIDGIFIFEKNNKPFSQMIQKCLSQAECSEVKQSFLIQKQMQHIALDVRFISVPSIQTMIEDYLHQEGIILDHSSVKKIVFSIKKRKIYSSLLGMYVDQYVIQSKTYYKGKLLKEEKHSFLKEELLSYIKSKILT